MLVLKTVDELEAAIDSLIETSSLSAVPVGQAVWTVMSVADNLFYEDLTNKVRLQFAIWSLTQYVDIPLRVLLRNRMTGGDVLDARPNDQHFLEASRWLKRCHDYHGFETIFPLWRRGRIHPKVIGNYIDTEELRRVDRYDAYNVVQGKKSAREGRSGVSILASEKVVRGQSRLPPEASNSMFG
jgi:hypothetical protein